MKPRAVIEYPRGGFRAIDRFCRHPESKFIIFDYAAKDGT
jgi:hypothetical protein